MIQTSRVIEACRAGIVVFVAAPLLVGCATVGKFPKGELRYAQRFCEAHAMIGVVREVDFAIAAKWSDYDDFSIGANKADVNSMQQRLRGYTTRWQHLHQRLNTACRDFASCRFRAGTAAALECDPLRQRLDDTTERGRRFLIDLQRVAGHDPFVPFSELPFGE